MNDAPPAIVLDEVPRWDSPHFLIKQEAAWGKGGWQAGAEATYLWIFGFKWIVGFDDLWRREFAGEFFHGMDYRRKTIEIGRRENALPHNSAP